MVQAITTLPEVAVTSTPERLICVPTPLSNCCHELTVVSPVHRKMASPYGGTGCTPITHVSPPKAPMSLAAPGILWKALPSHLKISFCALTTHAVPCSSTAMRVPAAPGICCHGLPIVAPVDRKMASPYGGIGRCQQHQCPSRTGHWIPSRFGLDARYSRRISLIRLIASSTACSGLMP
jgi:hypothetical protein